MIPGVGIRPRSIAVRRPNTTPTAIPRISTTFACGLRRGISFFPLVMSNCDQSVLLEHVVVIRVTLRTGARSCDAHAIGGGGAGKLDHVGDRGLVASGQQLLAELCEFCRRLVGRCSGLDLFIGEELVRIS